MRIPTLVITLAVLIIVSLPVNTVFASSKNRPSASDKDISAIGHRGMGGKGLGNWYSLDQEKEMGKQWSAVVDQSSKILDDPAITQYVARVAENISRNSDAQLPITVRLLDSERVEAFSLPGGYQYVTRGLLLQLENESQLASVLARGIAHTALRSSTRLMTREQYANIGTLPLIFIDRSSSKLSSDPSNFGKPVAMLKFRRGYEAAADYFGAQYVYKTGYSLEGFSQVIQKIWPATPTASEALNSFPATPDRLKALQAEIAEIMPKRDGEIVSTPEFEEFQKRLHILKPPGPVPTLK